jgi:HlyD family secretion protein
MTLPKWLAAALAAVVPGWGAPDTTHFNGYLEGDYLYPAAVTSGRIADVAVEEGQAVKAGDLLFRLEADREQLALAAAEASVAAAKAHLDDLSTGAREADLEVIRASLRKARAERDLAQHNLERSERLVQTGSVTEVKVQNDQTALEAAEAQVAQLAAQLDVAEMPARAAQRQAAEAQVREAEAQADIARRTLTDLTVTAPKPGLVEKLYFSAGEVVSTGAPVLRLLPPGSMKAIFFIPEPARSGFHPGDRMEVTCTGCPAGLTATITRLAESPQYTPPIIYSETERARLVFRAEAQMESDAPLLPGQPITLEPRP